MHAADWYSVAKGNWNSPSTWASVSGGSPGAGVPGTGDNVYIEGGNTVTLDVNTASLNNLDIASGSTFIVSGSYSVSATAITVNGIYRNSGTGPVTGTMTVNGRYQHAFTNTAGTIPAATWGSSSVCEFVGYTTAGSTTPTIAGIGQAFSSIVWNCTNQSAPILLTNSPLNTGSGVAFSVSATGSSYLGLDQAASLGSVSVTGGTLIAAQASTVIITVAGDVTVNGGNLTITGSAGAGTMNVAGSTTVNAGMLAISNGKGAGVMTVTGSLNLNGGVLNMSGGAGPSTLNVAGNVIQSVSNTFTRSSSGAATLVCNGTAPQMLTASGTILNGVNITIDNTSGVTLGADITGLSGTLRMNASSILDLSSYSLTTTGMLYLYGSSSVIKGTGTLTLGLSVNASSRIAASVECPVVLGTDCIFSGNGSVSFSGSISGGYNITKGGTGTLTLKGANTYTGVTIVNAGAVNIQNASSLGSADGGTVVNSGAALQLQGGVVFNSEPLTITGTGVSNTGALRNISGTNTWPSTVTLAGDAMIYSGGGSLNLTASNAITGVDVNLTAGGNYATVISGSVTTGAGSVTKTGAGTLTLSAANTYTGTTTINAGVINIQNASALGSTLAGTVVNAGALYLQGDITCDAEPLTITGTGISSTGVLRNISGVNTWTGPVNMAGSSLICAGAGTLNINAPAAITGAGSDLTIYAGTGSFVNINGAIAIGKGAVVKTGSGTCTFSAASTYSGATTISAGVLNIKNASALGTTSGSTTVVNGAVLQLLGGIVYDAEPITLAGVGVSSYGALRNVSGDNTWTGPITLSATSKIYSDAGTLTINAPHAITADSYNLASAGAGDITIAGTIDIGSGTLTKSDAGTLTLTGANPYSGATFISAGIVNIRNASALGSTSGPTTVYSGAVLQLQGGIIYDAEPLTLAGSGISTTGALRSISGDNTWSGPLTLSAAARIACDAGTLTLSAANTVTATNQSLMISGSGNVTIDGSIETGSGNLIKYNAGTLTLKGASTYTGTTTVSAGIVSIQNSMALGTSAGYTLVSSGAALQVSGGITVEEPLRIYGSGINGTGALRNISGNNTWSGVIAQYAASTLSCDAGTFTVDVPSGNAITGGYALTFAGAGDFLVADPIATGAGALTKNGAGTLTLSAANTYTGLTTVNAGKLESGIENAIATGKIALNRGTLSTGTPAGYNDAVGTLALTDNSVIALGTGSHSLTFAGSSAVTWTDNALLAVTGWTGTTGSSGTSGRLFFGNSSSGLTASQLSHILFLVDGSYYSSTILTTGEVVPGTATDVINTGLLPASAYCPGSGAITVPFTYTIASNYGSATFTAQLSDASGSFGVPTDLGSVASNASGSQTITFAIPASTPEGSGYRIRVISDNPPVAGFDNGTDITIDELYSVSVSPSGDQTVCSEGTAASLNVTDAGGGGIMHQWGKRAVPGGAVTDITGATSTAYTPSGQELGEGTWYIVCTSTSLCGTSLTSSNEIKVSVLSGSIWIGGAPGSETDWNNDANWCGGIPIATDNIDINSSSLYFPDIQPLSVIECKDMTIGSGAHLTIEPGGALTIHGNIDSQGVLIINSTLTSSGSMIVEGTASGKVKYNRQMKTPSDAGYNSYDRHYFSSPVVSNTDINSMKVNAVYGWDEVSGTWYTTNLTSLKSGEGYILDQTAASDGLISFTGGIAGTAGPVHATSPYSDCDFTGEDNRARSMAPGRDTISNYGGGGWNLLGNPFTSAMSAAAFITDNYGSIDPDYLALYIFDSNIGVQGAYYYISAGNVGWSDPEGSQYSGENIQAGQGFFVSAMCNSSAFNFNSGMQRHDIAAPVTKSAKSADRWPGLRLKVSTQNGVASTLVVFDPQMKNGLDPGYDIGQLSSGADVELYTLLVQDNGINFARQALPSTGTDDIIVPVGLDFSTGGEVTFTAETEPLEGYKFLLEDRITSALTDLSASSYTVTIPADAAGPGRFFLHVKSNATGVDPVPDGQDQARLRIWLYHGEIIIKGDVSDKAVAGIYDISGKMVCSKRLIEGSYNTITAGFGKNGMYIVKVTDGTRVTTGKVMVVL